MHNINLNWLEEETCRADKLCRLQAFLHAAGYSSFKGLTLRLEWEANVGKHDAQSFIYCTENLIFSKFLSEDVILEMIFILSAKTIMMPS